MVVVGGLAVIGVGGGKVGAVVDIGIGVGWLSAWSDPPPYKGKT